MTARDLGRALVSYAWTGLASSLAVGSHAVGGDAEDLKRHTLRWARVLERLWDLELRVEGIEHYRSDTPTVLVANHQSYVDVVALFLTLPEMPVFLAKRELSQVPLFGRAMATRGDVFIDRQKHDKATTTIGRAAGVVRPGAPLLVFPEGTRAPRPEIQRFKKGAFHLARQAHAAIQPVGIHGSFEAWPRERAAPTGGVVRVVIGEPMLAEVVQSTDLDALVDRMRREVARLADLPLAPDPDPRRT